LGTVQATTWAREGEPPVPAQRHARKKHTSIEEKESRRWLDTLRHARLEAGACAADRFRVGGRQRSGYLRAAGRSAGRAAIARLDRARLPKPGRRAGHGGSRRHGGCSPSPARASRDGAGAVHANDSRPRSPDQVFPKNAPAADENNRVRLAKRKWQSAPHRSGSARLGGMTASYRRKL
jgi:hypothetical protein